MATREKPIVLGGMEDFATEVGDTFGDIGAALAKPSMAVRPVAKRILRWDARKLPADARKVVVNLKEAARTLVRFDTIHKAQLKTQPTIYLAGSFDAIATLTSSPLMVFGAPYNNAPWTLRGVVMSPTVSAAFRVQKFEVAGIDVVVADKAVVEGAGALAATMGADPVIFAHDGLDKHFVAPWIGQVFTPEAKIKFKLFNYTASSQTSAGITLKVQATPCDATWQGVYGPFRQRLDGLQRMVRPFASATRR